ncbi:MAG: lytic transglycosylase domain-containing protein [Bryobacteraceae bacterium]
MKLARSCALLISILAACPSFGKELVYLASGFRLEIQSHTEANQTLLLRMASGTLELPTASVARIELVADDSDQPAANNPSLMPKGSVELLSNAAAAQGLPTELVQSVAQIESGLRQEALSPKGALGLMQLMPATAADLGVKAACAGDNAQGGAKYLRKLLLYYRGDAVLALAAYNAGPGAVAKFGGVPPYSETRRYVERVLREFARQQKLRVSRILQTNIRPSKPISTN